jgi:hypothetical protein
MAKASDILGKTIANAQKEELGEGNDLIVDRNGEISYPIVSRGGLLGMGDELVPIPWSSAGANFRGDKRFVNIGSFSICNSPHSARTSPGVRGDPAREASLNPPSPVQRYGF